MKSVKEKDWRLYLIAYVMLLVRREGAGECVNSAQDAAVATQRGAYGVDSGGRGWTGGWATGSMG